MTSLPQWALDAATDISAYLFRKALGANDDVAVLLAGVSRDEIAGIIASRQEFAAGQSVEFIVNPVPFPRHAPAAPVIAPDRLDAIRKAAEIKAPARRPGPRAIEVKAKQPPADIGAAIRKHLKGKKGHKDRISRLAGILHTDEANIELAVSNRGSGLEFKDGYVVEGK